jgi:hypothetical protein
VNDCTLDNALKTCSGLGFIVARIRGQIRQLVLDVIQQALFERIKINRTCAQDCRSITVIEEGQQQMLKSCILVPTFVGGGESPVQRLFQIP